MFNEFCYWLNCIGLSRVAAALRWIVFKTAVGVERAQYDTPQAGYQGWIRRAPFGVLAFIDTDNRLHFRW